MVVIDMTISLELIISLAIQLITVGIFLGTYKQTINFMQQQIQELKDDMKRYNNILQRMIVAEQSIKAIWHNIDEAKND